MGEWVEGCGCGLLVPSNLSIKHAEKVRLVGACLSFSSQWRNILLLMLVCLCSCVDDREEIAAGTLVAVRRILSILISILADNNYIPKLGHFFAQTSKQVQENCV